MSIFDFQEKLASELLSKKGIFVISKVTRAGCTNSSVKVALEQGLRVVVIVPKKKIGEELISSLLRLLKTPKNMFLIGSNAELCPKSEKLDMIFLYREYCKECELNGKPNLCPFQNLLMNSFDLIVLTYSKLKALQISESDDAKHILAKLASSDLIVFDEFSCASVPQIRTINIASKDPDGKIHMLREQLMPLLPKPELWSLPMLMMMNEFENKPTGVYLNHAMESQQLDEGNQKKIFSKGWKQITRLTRKGEETKKLQLIFLASFSTKIVITNVGGNVDLTPSVEDALWYIKKFMALLGSEKRVFIVDAYQPSVNFESIFGDCPPVIWGKNGDPLNTNAQQLILADTAHWGKQDFFKDTALQNKYKGLIMKIIDLFSAERVIIVTLSKSMSDAIHGWGLSENILITYYRSKWMRGIPIEGRDVMILLNGPYIPRRAYDAQSKSLRLEDFVTEMEGLQTDWEKASQLPRLLWLDDVRGEFVNCIGRVKDPEGVRRSIVFAFGMRFGEVKSLLKDNSPFKLSKPNVTKTLLNGAMEDEGLLIAQMWMDGETIEAMELSVLARIICETKKKKIVAASQVVMNQTELVKPIAQKHTDVLEKYGVSVVSKTGGMAFEAKEQKS